MDGEIWNINVKGGAYEKSRHYGSGNNSADAGKCPQLLSQEPEVTTAPMADNFMWIGSNDFQWCEGLENFRRTMEKEYEEPPVLISDEEYHLLFHDRNVWVVCGRYRITSVMEDGTALHAHVRGTYVWRMINGELKLAHVHGSHAQDIPLNPHCHDAGTAYRGHGLF